jgi:exopolyphosphatase/pppGpp-phosphohydrolase
MWQPARSTSAGMTDDPQLATHQLDALLGQLGDQLPDPEHGRRCARFAGELFDALHEPLLLAAADRPLAVLAALLHDIGHLRGERDHQRKSFDIIRESELAGVPAHDKLIVACAARYHRGQLPNIEHAGFGEMTTEDQRRTRRLSALVRLAAALDASQLGFISDVNVSAGGPALRVTALATQEPAVERDQLRDAASAFESLTYLPLRIEIQVERDGGK